MEKTICVYCNKKFKNTLNCKKHMKIRYLPKSFCIYSYDDVTHITKLKYNDIEFSADVLCCYYQKYIQYNKLLDGYTSKYRKCVSLECKFIEQNIPTPLKLKKCIQRLYDESTYWEHVVDSQLNKLHDFHINNNLKYLYGYSDMLLNQSRSDPKICIGKRTL
jgi:hypothetical protein